MKKGIIKRSLVFLLALSFLFAEIPIAKVHAAVSATEEQAELKTEYVDLSDEVLREGGYLSEASATEIAAYSVSQEARRESLKEKLMEAWDSFAATCDVSGDGITAEDLKAVYSEALNENYRYFYVYPSYSYSYLQSDNSITTVQLYYTMTKAEAEEKLAVYEAAVSDALKGADSSWSDLEKALYINDYLTRNCEYDTSCTKYTAYDALVEKTAVCNGYALAYQLLARELGLSCEVVTSEELDHAWNLVKIGTSYYHVDATWNDPVSDRIGRARHLYFMKSSAYFNSSTGGHEAEDWIISGGVTQESASDTGYDDYFWNSVNTGFEYADGNWYGIVDTDIYEFSCNGKQFTQGTAVLSIPDTWMVWGSSNSYWQGSYASLASYNGKLYYSLTDAIYEFDPSTGKSAVMYALSESQKASGYIYGMRITTDSEIEYLLATSPNSVDMVGTYTTAALATPLSGCTVTLGTTSYTYDGTAKQPAVTVKNGTTTLVKDKDYTVSYSNNTNAGTATVTITGKGNYTGTVTKTFTISKATQTLTATISQSEITVGGTAVITASGTGSITYTSGNTGVATVSSSGTVTGISAGTAVITVAAAGNSNYNGRSTTITVTVKEAAPVLTSLSGCTVTLGTTSYTYDGTAKQPAVTVKNGTTTLVKDKDYTVSYSNNTNAGTATVTITGKGNYTGTVTKTFTISKATQTLTATISQSEITVGGTAVITASGTGSITYTSGNTGVATVSSSGTVTGVSAGTAVITVAAAGNSNYNGRSTTITVTVKEAAPVLTSLSGCTVTLGTTSYTYDGTAKQPAVTVKNGTTTLVKDKDYTVSYSNHTNAGTATVTITGKGNYTGTVTKTFTISKATQTLTATISQSEITVGGTAVITASGTGSITYTSGNMKVAAVSSSGTVTGVSAGTAVITVAAAGNSNYNGRSTTITVTVKEAAPVLTSLSGCTVTLGTTSYTYDRTAKQPAVTVKNGTTTLVKDKDYTVSYSNNTNAGTATVTITGKGNYTGTVTKTFTISKASQTLTATIAASSLIYGKTSQITASGTGTITYTSSNTSVATVSASGLVTAKGAGTATITVKAAGNSNYSAATQTIKVSVLYATPAISSVSNVNGGVQINWGKVTGAVKYRVYRKTGSGSWTKLGDTTGTGFTDKTAKSGTTYIYTIRCISSDAKSFTSGYNTAGKSIKYIAAPAISSVSNVNGGVQINWGKVTGAAKYRVYRKTGSGSWAKLGDTTGTSFTDKTAKSGTTYTYTIRCISSDAKSFTSGYNTAGKSIKYIAAPAISSVSNVSGGVQVKWGKVTGAVKYRVYRKTGSGSWTKLGDTTGTSFTDKTAKSGTTYTYTIRCISSDAKSFTSGYNTAGKSIKYIAAPALPTLTKTSAGVQVKWSKVTGAAKYRVYRKTGSGSWTKVGDTTGTSFVDKTAKKGNTYTYTIRCISSDGKSFTSAYNATGKKITVK